MGGAVGAQQRPILRAKETQKTGASTDTRQKPTTYILYDYDPLCFLSCCITIFPGFSLQIVFFCDIRLVINFFVLVSVVQW
jgi:hypothetical protein